MTRKEAKKILIACKDDGHYPHITEALDVAIDALEQLSSYERTINKLTNAISEQEQFEKDLLIIKSVGFLTLEDLDFVRNEIIEQRKTGVVVLRQGWEAVLVPSDVEIKFEEREGKS